MPHGFTIQYRLHHEIDKIKWDKCIGEADNGLIYGYSFYLDHMAKHWDALIANDYQAVMPLTWNKKSGICYLYQPSFTASGGVFGKNLSKEIVNEFIQLIPKKFRLIEISLNYGNIPDSSPFLISRTNYILPLNKDYGRLYKDYRENHQRNIQKALQAGCILLKNIPADEIIELNKKQLKNISSITAVHYARFKKLHQLLSDNNNAATYGVINKEKKLLASCIFFFSHKRAYYILAGNHPDGRNTGASHALIDAFIKDHAGEDLILDFEGSDVESLALFYSGFGATRETYPAIRWNRLPWYLKWMKK